MLNSIVTSQLCKRTSPFYYLHLHSSRFVHTTKVDNHMTYFRLFPKYIPISQSTQYRRLSAGYFGNDGDKDVPNKERFIHKTEVERFITECMMKVGAEQFRAKMLAANLTEADYVGHFSHGLNRLNVYVKDCQGKFCKPNNDPIILNESPGTAWVDGNNGLGVVVGTFCMNRAIEMAKVNGIGWVVAKGSNHFGVCQW